LGLLSILSFRNLRKHIVTKEALTGAGELIGIDESADLGVVISALEVVESGL